MNRSECDTLAARFDSLKARGLVDVKFLLRDEENATREGVCAEVEQMLVSHLEGKSKAFTFGDSHRS
ncbi:hypothetical protein ACMAUO_06245 [Gluconacetobacter sp. Hr-1-5]|uniref:hypothetical protein n=1 Tax=Gluconacetobacter sp. Hr-1-5 TaxID=3395370 RepID=UPI003B5183C5